MNKYLLLLLIISLPLPLSLSLELPSQLPFKLVQPQLPIKLPSKLNLNNRIKEIFNNKFQLCKDLITGVILIFIAIIIHISANIYIIIIILLIGKLSNKIDKLYLI